jgi:hypothetical protein
MLIARRIDPKHDICVDSYAPGPRISELNPTYSCCLCKWEDDFTCYRDLDNPSGVQIPRECTGPSCQFCEWKEGITIENIGEYIKKFGG